MSKHPMQPIEIAADGVVRFRPNKLVQQLRDRLRDRLSTSEYSELISSASPEDQMQWNQLIGYSVSGYGDLGSSSAESIQTADEIADRICAKAKKSR